MFEFWIVPGTAVRSIIDGDPSMIREVVRNAYLCHHNGLTVNPDSYFLRFPGRPRDRLIALPASISGDIDVIGIKWIASFPDNVRSNIPRASAVLLLNDPTTGFPFACLEAATISAARTAASAALATEALGGEPGAGRLGVIGGGVIARAILDQLADAGFRFEGLICHDVDRASAHRIASHAAVRRLAERTDVTERAEGSLDCDLVLLATTAAEPYIPADSPIRPGQLFLNISLRDLAPELLLRSNNIVDDVDHCLKAGTSPHLAEQRSGGRDFVTGTLPQILNEEVMIDRSLPTIFSPFGLGSLDLALGKFVFERAVENNAAIAVEEFFGETARW